jgi:DNA-binding Xre family transcriptional regulator
MTNLARVLIAYEEKYDIRSRGIAKEIGIGASTLTRIKQGKMPDADGFAKIMAWLARAARA